MQLNHTLPLRESTWGEILQTEWKKVWDHSQFNSISISWLLIEDSLLQEVSSAGQTIGTMGHLIPVWYKVIILLALLGERNERTNKYCSEHLLRKKQSSKNEQNPDTFEISSKNSILWTMPDVHPKLGTVLLIKVNTNGSVSHSTHFDSLNLVKEKMN